MRVVHPSPPEAEVVTLHKPTAEPFDVDRVRCDFPILARAVRSKSLVYLDSAATTQKPRRVVESMARFFDQENANVHRGVHFLSEKATASYEGARERVRRFLNAREAREIIFVRGTTEAINLVAFTFGKQRVGPGDEVLVTAMEHHSNIVPWQMLCEEKGAKLVVTPIDDRGVLLLDELEKRIGPRTRMVAVTHVSNALGTVNPVKRIVELAHARGVPVLVDGAQGASHVPADVQDIGCDFYALSGHKI
jgi:cysteine desulfurase / selenocysteine lyase